MQMHLLYNSAWSTPRGLPFEALSQVGGYVALVFLKKGGSCAQPGWLSGLGIVLCAEG